jgi:transcription-repair coupling factor (superfamily II helicase)
MFINNAHQFGVSQLYQLRGRIGRSKERAYCYLILPAHKKIDKEAQERIRIIHENTALGSGLKVAHYDLELRGAGDLLGAEQSGHVDAVGYETYLELLDEAVRELKGDSVKEDSVEPEINLRIPAFIPSSYMPDLRIRLSYYKELSSIRGPEDLDRIEGELRDQFGEPTLEVMNFLGLMLIRKTCRDLGVKDISAGTAWLTLAFTEKTLLPPHEVVRLATQDNKKYTITPDQRLKIRMKEITWPRVMEELEFLIKLCPRSS